MGIPKHGKESAKAKASKKYKDSGAYQLNKIKKAKKHAKLIEKFRIRREKKSA